MPIWMYCQCNSKLYNGIVLDGLCHKAGVYKKFCKGDRKDF